MTTHAQVQTPMAPDPGLIVAVGAFPDGVTEPLVEVRDVRPDQEPKLQQPGHKHMAADGTITVTPPPPPPIEYVADRGVSALIRTTDDQPLEVFRLATQAKHVYAASFRMTAVDAGNGTTKRARAEMTFKGLAASVAQVGTTVTSTPMQDAGATGWVIQPSTDGVDLIISVRGAAGRTVDWSLAGDIEIYAPEGLEA